MPLRKVLLFASAGAPADNLASFTNVTAKRLHIRKSKLYASVKPTVVASDQFTLELAERATAVGLTNDTRALIDIIGMSVGDSTGAGLVGRPWAQSTMSFNRGDLVMDTDESLFLNGNDIQGAAGINGGCNLFYED